MLWELQFLLACAFALSPVAVMLIRYILSVTKEIEKQGHDLEDVTSKLEESEVKGQRLQRELESVQDLHRKVNDLVYHHKKKIFYYHLYQNFSYQLLKGCKLEVSEVSKVTNIFEILNTVKLALQFQKWQIFFEIFNTVKLAFNKLFYVEHLDISNWIKIP